MKKASNILLTIGGIFSIIYAVIFLGLSIGFFISGSPVATNAIIEGLENGTIQTNIEGATTAEIAAGVQLLFIIIAVVFVIMMLFNVVNVVLISLAKKKQTKALYILNIVFGFISSATLNMVGGVFGLISASKRNNN